MDNPGLPPNLQSFAQAARLLNDSASMTVLRWAAQNASSAQYARLRALSEQHIWTMASIHRNQDGLRSTIRSLSEAARAQEETRQRVLQSAAMQWAERSRIAYSASRQPSATLAVLHRTLQDTAAFSGIPAQGRETAVRVLDDAFTSTSTSSVPPAEVPDDLSELVEEFEGTARTFVSSQAGFLPAKVQRALFVYFCGCLVIVALMQASFTSDAVDAVLDKAMGYAPMAAAAMLAAGKAFDRFTGYQPGPDEDDEQE